MTLYSCFFCGIDVDEDAETVQNPYTAIFEEVCICSRCIEEKGLVQGA